MQQVTIVPRPRAPPQTWALPRGTSLGRQAPRECWPWRAVQATYIAVPAVRRPFPLYARGFAPQRAHFTRKECKRWLATV